MYETEANARGEPADQIPAAVLERFSELSQGLTARTVLPWGEHCTECVWPTCYTSCDLYAPRDDGRCRRFVDGMVRLDVPGAVNGYVLKIAFKRWGKLWTAGNVHLYSPAEARRIERRDRYIGAVLYQIAAPRAIKRAATGRRYSYKKQSAMRRTPTERSPDAFVVECYNPNASPVSITLTLRSFDETRLVPFQKLLEVPPGYTRAAVPTSEIARVFDLRSPFHVELTPNAVDDGTTLYFGLLDFVTAPGLVGTPAGKKTKTCKCVVWDLDNTLWDGTLVEDGADALALKPGIADVIRRLDERGILHSIASKNTAEDALRVVERLGLAEYFLFPDISWGPKSEAVKRIAERLNIGMDSIVFVDDQAFERAEVEAACPGVRVRHADDAPALPDAAEFQVPVTAEARGRRALYRLDEQRQAEADRFSGDYMSFLRGCELVANLRALTRANLDRVHELTQRTNQMNFSGNRYEKAVLERIIADPHLDTFVLDVRDRFGEYGVVGFCIVDSREPRISDLMFSCRVQSKRVEHALLSYLIQRYGGGTADVFATYRKTPRNAPSGGVFDDVGFDCISEVDGVRSLVFPRGRTVPDDGIVEVIVHEREVLTPG